MLALGLEITYLFVLSLKAEYVGHCILYHLNKDWGKCDMKAGEVKGRIQLIACILCPYVDKTHLNITTFFPWIIDIVIIQRHR